MKKPNNSADMTTSESEPAKPSSLKRVVSRRRGSDGLYKSPDDSKIEDGFGSVWSAWCCMCGRKSMHVCRPGKVQCGYCG